MPTRLQEIHEMLNKKSVEHKVVDEKGYIATGSATEVYIDDDGRHGVSIMITADEDGEFIQVVAPNLYKNNQPQHEIAILKTCMHITRGIKMIQCEYDEADGEIRMLIDIPLEDNHLTEKQLMRVLACIVATVDSFDTAFRCAVEAGEVTITKIMAERSKKAKLARLIEDAPAAELDQLIQQLEFVNSSALPGQLQTLTN